jgi:hypothetical protein
MALARWTCYNTNFFLGLLMVRACTRYRGPDPPTDPDEQASARVPRQGLPAAALHCWLDGSAAWLQNLRP